MTNDYPVPVSGDPESRHLFILVSLCILWDVLHAFLARLIYWTF